MADLWERSRAGERRVSSPALFPLAERCRPPVHRAVSLLTDRANKALRNGADFQLTALKPPCLSHHTVITRDRAGLLLATDGAAVIAEHTCLTSTPREAPEATDRYHL